MSKNLNFILIAALLSAAVGANAQDWNCNLSSCGLSAACDDYKKTLTYSEAVSNCPVGYRLPTIEELECMAKNKSSLNIHFGEYWSGTPSKEENVYTVTMDDGNREECDKSEKNRVRYIKDPHHVSSENAELQAPQDGQSTDNQSTENYALVHLYRPGMYWGCGVVLKIDLEDGSVWKCKNNSRKTIKVTKETPFTLHGKTEADVNCTFDVEMGKEYYVKCSIGWGVMVGRPVFTPQDESEGRSAYGKIKAKNDDTDK